MVTRTVAFRALSGCNTQRAASCGTHMIRSRCVPARSAGKGEISAFSADGHNVRQSKCVLFASGKSVWCAARQSVWFASRKRVWFTSKKTRGLLQQQQDTAPSQQHHAFAPLLGFGVDLDFRGQHGHVLGILDHIRSGSVPTLSEENAVVYCDTGRRQKHRHASWTEPLKRLNTTL